jgi:sugar lactone lactonase YvrE
VKRCSFVVLAVAASLSACDAQGPEDPEAARAPAGLTALLGEQGQPGPASGSGALCDPLLDTRKQLVLPGETFFPEGIAVAADGTFFVGSFSSGQIVRVPPGARRAVPFLGPMSGAVAAGMIVDAATGALWACAIDPLFTAPAVVKRFDIATATETGSYAFPGIVCNDMALDGEGNLYATDSLNKTIFVLPEGTEAVVPWIQDDAFGGNPGEFSLNGIAFDGASNLYTVKYNTGELFRIAIEADGTAGAITPIAVNPPLAFADGLKVLDADTLLVVENDVGKLSRVKLSGAQGTKTVIADQLAEPTTAAIYGHSAWVVEGQLSFYFGFPGEPTLPFRVKRVGLH